MSNSYRIRTKPGVDSSIRVLIDQEFEYLEILSLKILQSQIYTRQCSDYGVIVGRVSINNGTGVPNAKVSIFVPLDSVDENNPIITDIYPYKTLTDLNEDGYRYNLLPYTKQHAGHTPTGTFFTREDVLVNPTLIQVYDKYFKYTAVTNESGDYMIFGVPLGSQTIFVDMDLSDIGEFSLSPQDLVRMGIANQNQVSGTKFKSSTNLRQLPQIITFNRTVEVEPLWGQPEVCNLGITRTDFDLSREANIDITPTAIFMGSLISSNESNFLKKNCKTKNKAGDLCELVTGPGEILAIRQTIKKDTQNRPLLEVYELEQGGQVIDENGTWLVDLPMNLDYVVTNEFGEQVLSTNTKIGVPTKARYRFKIKWNQSPSLSAEPIKRGYYLVPNIKEYGWSFDKNGKRKDPTVISATPTNSETINNRASQNSYSFSIDWEDYGAIDPNTKLQSPIGVKMIDDAINCIDKFYEFQYNKVYTTSQLITQYRKGYTNSKIIAIKDILNSECESETNKFPTNDGLYQFDIIYTLFNIVLFILSPILYILLLVVHVLSFVVYVLYLLFPNKLEKVKNLFTNLQIPVLSYPDCEFCQCSTGQPANQPTPSDLGLEDEYKAFEERGGLSVLSPFEVSGQYTMSTLYITNNQAYEQLFSGTKKGEASKNTLTPATRIPGIELYYTANTAPDRADVFTNSLSLFERLNLFNTKAKYFNAQGGVNQIRVGFNHLKNPSVFHYDNVIVIITKPEVETTFRAGNIISFQNTNLSKDPNITGYTSGNVYGTNSITGTTFNNSGNLFTVDFADPDNPGNTLTSQPYISEQDPMDALYAKFNMDIEYFQVITGLTISDYAGLTSNTLANSLPVRFLFNNMYFYRIQRYDNITYTDGSSLNGPYLKPSDFFNDFPQQRIVFLVRGVDPNSTRSNCQYDLSRLFGKDYTDPNPIIIKSGINNAPKYKLNIPIQGGYKNVRHNLTNSDDVDFYSNMNLYHDSYHFEPSFTQFTAFTSNLPSYYSSLDANNMSFTPDGNNPLGSLSNKLFNPDAVQGLKVQNDSTKNRFVGELTSYYPSPLKIPMTISYTNNTVSNRGYFINEIVEGGSVFYGSLVPLDLGTEISLTSFGEPVIQETSYELLYYAPKYPSTTNISFNLGFSNRQIVMRSDRLPTSTVTEDNLNNSFALHSNNRFTAYYITDNGEIIPPDLGIPSQVTILTGVTADSSDNSDQPGFVSSVIDSFSCGKMAPIDCYTTVNGRLVLRPLTDKCYKAPGGGKDFINGSCYVFVSTPFLSLFKDYQMLPEMINRLNITFAACRNVFGHIFTNNWINGTLYAFSFRNDVTYTSPFATTPNQATYNYCKDVIMLHNQTYNFYYRSSPYLYQPPPLPSVFIGANAPSPNTGLFGPYGGNKYNLNFPTTLMDLGPRNDYIQELVMSDEYDGYVVNKLTNTTYSDVSELLNLFVMSRLVNTNFLSALTSGINVLSYFTRPNNMIDGDYAQSISISSELGVAPFESSNYPDNPPNQNPIYINTFSGNWNKQVFGVFFSSDTQTRDFITPKRTIINPYVPQTSPCAFNKINVFSQEVPFYQWYIDTNNVPNSIFGSQTNDWYSVPINNNGFFTKNYQSLDRLEENSRYYRTNNSSKTDYFKGYIYGVDNNGKISPDTIYRNSNTPSPQTAITNGAPFHFYFGLKRGKTAFDRFTTKWINTNKVVL